MGSSPWDPLRRDDPNLLARCMQHLLDFWTSCEPQETHPQLARILSHAAATAKWLRSPGVMTYFPKAGYFTPNLGEVLAAMELLAIALDTGAAESEEMEALLFALTQQLPRQMLIPCWLDGYRSLRPDS